jgi:hypothetical protein
VAICFLGKLFPKSTLVLCFVDRIPMCNYLVIDGHP